MEKSRSQWDELQQQIGSLKGELYLVKCEKKVLMEAELGNFFHKTSGEALPSEKLESSAKMVGCDCRSSLLQV